MKKRYWVMLAGAYAAAMTGYFVYEYAQTRRSEVEVIPVIYTTASYTEAATVLTKASTARTVQTTTAAATATSSSTTVSTTQTSTAQTTQQTTTSAAATTTVTATAETTTDATTVTTVSYPLILNTATLEQLCTLPDIGEALAQAILDKREKLGGFTNRKQLLEIPGIGESRYDEIRWLLYLDDEQPMTDPVPFTPDMPSPETAPSAVNLNTASREDLLRLPGCDETTADNILWLRENIQGFRNTDELLNLVAAGEHTVSNIRSLYDVWKPFLFVDDNGSKPLS